MADYNKYSRKSDPSFAWADAQERGKKAAKKTSRQKAINAIKDKYMPSLKMYGVAVNLSPEEQRAMNKELKRYGTTYNEIIKGATKSRAPSTKLLRAMGEDQAERRASARKAGAPRMSLKQLEAAAIQEMLPSGGGKPSWGGPKKGLYKTPVDAIDQMMDYATQGPEGGAKLQKQMQGRLAGTQQGMAQKLMKGGGSIRLPQLRGGLPMMLLALLAGGLGMGMGSDGNEEIDALLG